MVSDTSVCRAKSEAWTVPADGEVEGKHAPRAPPSLQAQGRAEASGLLELMGGGSRAAAAPGNQVTGLGLRFPGDQAQ